MRELRKLLCDNLVVALGFHFHESEKQKLVMKMRLWKKAFLFCAPREIVLQVGKNYVKIAISNHLLLTSYSVSS